MNIPIEEQGNTTTWIIHFGYVTTDNGILSKEDGTMKYVRTMVTTHIMVAMVITKCYDKFIPCKRFCCGRRWHLIYGTDTVTMSIPEVTEITFTKCVVIKLQWSRISL